MFGLFRAGGFAAASVMLSASVMSVGHTQVLPLPQPFDAEFVASGSMTAPVTASAPILSPVSDPAESPQLVLPVQSAPVTSFVQPTPPAVPQQAEPVAVAVAVPPVSAPRPRATLAQLVAEHRGSDTPTRELECLAGAIYFESKGEPLPGQVAVGQVIVNRAKSGRFPGSYCGVVFQRSQFSFVRGRALPPIPRGSAHWKTAVAVAHIVARDLHESVAPKALFFHARYVSPNWKRMSKVATVGNHVFYR